MITHLRPATHLGAVGLAPLHLFARKQLAPPEYEQSRGVRVCHEHHVSRVLVYEPRERVQVRLLIDEEPVARDRRAQLHGLEEIIGRRASKYREPVGLGQDLGLKVGEHALGVLIEAQAFGGGCGIGLCAVGKLFAHEGLKVVAAVLVRLGVQIKAYERKSGRLESGKAVQQVCEGHILPLFRCRSTPDDNTRRTGRPN